MKKTELIEIIRTLVKEEVHNTLPQLLMEVLAEKLTGQEVLTEKVAEAPKRRVNVGLEAPVKQVPSQVPKVFTKNPILNQVLNETVGGVPQEAEASTQSTLDVIKTIPKEMLNENKEVAAVANALTRDYSKLIRAADEKAKAKRPA
jgi:proline dehydrogenase